MDIPELKNIFSGDTPRSITIGTLHSLPTIQVPPTAKARNEFTFEELRQGIEQAYRQVKRGGPALALRVRFHPSVAFGMSHTIGWRGTNPYLWDRTLGFVSFQPLITDPELPLRFNEEAGIVTIPAVQAEAKEDDNAEGFKFGLNDFAITTRGDIFPNPEPPDARFVE